MPCLRLLIPTLLLVLPLAAHADNGARDPWQGFNRGVFAFNEWFDRWLGKPVARGYRAALPQFVDDRVTRFFANLGDVPNAANLALQGEGRQALDTAGRVVANTSLGLGGLFDVASAGGIARRDTSFGTTLGKWGAGSGPYLVLPFLGPSTVRDVAGIPADWFANPLPEPWTLFPHEPTRYAIDGVYIIDRRADLLQYEQAMVGDRYAFLRDIFLQRRDFEVDGGSRADPFLEDDE